MTLRRIVAGFFVFLFILITIPTFFVYALSRSFFSGSFYRDPLIEMGYNGFIEVATTHLYNFDPRTAKYFDKQTINKELKKAMTPEVLQSVTSQFGDQIEKIKKNPDEPGIVNTQLIREGFITATHNLAYQLFEQIPLCMGSELPEINVDGIPTCIPPQNANYAEISGPLSKQFEKAAYSFFPEQIQIDLRHADNRSNGFYILFTFIDSLKIYLLSGLVLVMAMIALTLYNPISLMIYYEAIALSISGFLGILLGIGIEMISLFFIQGISHQLTSSRLEIAVFEHPETFSTFQRALSEVLSSMVSHVIHDIQKISLAFLLLGVVLIFIHLVLKRKPRHNY